MLIIGGGPAGLTAALYAARANLRPVLVTGMLAGGQLMNTTDVENFPGFPDGILGPELMERFQKQAERFGCRMIYGEVSRVEFARSPFVMHLSDGQRLLSQSVILATGASPRKLGVPGEELAPAGYGGRGVSYCATCDAPFFRNRTVAVVGGGDSALEEAGFITRFASKVYLIHRRDRFRGSKIMQDRVLANPKVEMKWNTVVTEVTGDGKVMTALKVRSTTTGTNEDLACNGLFVAVGHDPNTALFRGIIDTDETGYIRMRPGTTQTSVAGVFVAGDAADRRYRQAVTAAGTGCMAALDAQRYLEEAI